MSRKKHKKQLADGHEVINKMRAEIVKHVAEFEFITGRSVGRVFVYRHHNDWIIEVDCVQPALMDRCA